MKEYIVALLVGGIMEMPEFSYSDGQIIKAKSKNDAVRIYDEKNNCRFFHGDVVAVKKRLGWKVIDCKVSKPWLQSMLNQENFKQK